MKRASKMQCRVRPANRLLVSSPILSGLWDRGDARRPSPWRAGGWLNGLCGFMSCWQTTPLSTFDSSSPCFQCLDSFIQPTECLSMSQWGFKVGAERFLLFFHLSCFFASLFCGFLTPLACISRMHMLKQVFRVKTLPLVLFLLSFLFSFLAFLVCIPVLWILGHM